MHAAEDLCTQETVLGAQLFIGMGCIATGSGVVAFGLSAAGLYSVAPATHTPRHATPVIDALLSKKTCDMRIVATLHMMLSQNRLKSAGAERSAGEAGWAADPARVKVVAETRDRKPKPAYEIPRPPSAESMTSEIRLDQGAVSPRTCRGGAV